MKRTSLSNYITLKRERITISNALHAAAFTGICIISPLRAAAFIGVYTAYKIYDKRHNKRST